VDGLTNRKDFNFAEICLVIYQRKLDNDVSEAKSSLIDVSTLDRYSSSVRYSARILTTQRVVPQNRCVNLRVSIGQTNDEVVRSVT